VPFIEADAAARAGVAVDKHPEPPLFGRSAEETGLIWKAISEFQSYALPLAERIVVPAFGGRPLDVADMQAAAGELHGELGRLEQAVAAHGWLAVEQLSAADLAVYPFVEALLRADGKEGIRPMGLGFLPLAESYAALEDWRERVAALPGYARTYPPHWREAG
jgi:glutathione S-transferase